MPQAANRRREKRARKTKNSSSQPPSVVPSKPPRRHGPGNLLSSPLSVSRCYCYRAPAALLSSQHLSLSTSHISSHRCCGCASVHRKPQLFPAQSRDALRLDLVRQLIAARIIKQPSCSVTPLEQGGLVQPKEDPVLVAARPQLRRGTVICVRNFWSVSIGL
ncbi:hypothetical protein VTN00DRAFT_7729 [Thermoascus crustaceus]|uniref:uncharacterized protein n=1 Tax=Thermoascus crustaceus TaxID=5088 RepID=UPI0037439723